MDPQHSPLALDDDQISARCDGEFHRVAESFGEIGAFDFRGMGDGTKDGKGKDGSHVRELVLVAVAGNLSSNLPCQQEDHLTQDGWRVALRKTGGLGRMVAWAALRATAISCRTGPMSAPVRRQINAPWTGSTGGNPSPVRCWKSHFRLRICGRARCDHLEVGRYFRLHIARGPTDRTDQDVLEYGI